MPRKTNIEFINDLCDFSNYGALAQVFVIEALTKYANAVAKADLADLGDNPFISNGAWQGVAREIKEKLDAHYQ